MGRNFPFFPVYHHRGRLSISNFAEAQKTPLRRQKQRGQGKEDYWFFTESWGANKGLGKAPKSCTRKEHESATNPIAKRGQGGTSSLFICPLQGQGTASLVGFGATPQQFHGRPASKRTQQRRRQRSVPASNFARPQTRPQAALPQDSVKNRKNLRNTAAFRRKKDVYIEEVTSSIQSLDPSAAQPRRQQPPALRRG